MPADADAVAMIQGLIPLGLQAVAEALQPEVTRLARDWVALMLEERMFAENALSSTHQFER